MLSAIEAELRRRCADNENLRLLVAQWEYDRLLLGQALTTVAHAFPHYSLHDATHSETILERIAAMVGTDSLVKLSATDLWLLLESAYLHDSGMVVLDSTRRKDLASSEFESHLRAMADGPDEDLAARAARILERYSGKNALDILEGHLDVLLVYAEFARKMHPQRAEDVALAPFENVRVDSPRTTLLPNRLWHIIGRICRAHGESRDFVMCELPLQESGIGGEICHPRFVACLLRLGDLLDLDSGRFCPTINATIPQLPKLSEAHRAKHAGIRRLLVCPTRIEVSGVYNDVNAYLEAERWFAWLREELSAQLVRWDEIAPPFFGTLPSAGSIEARLEGQVTLDAAARPRFEVDREKIIELVQGANIYDGPEDALREVIQNAIDATLYRFSYDAQANGDSLPKDLEDLRLRLRNYPIDVSLTKAHKQPADRDKVEWTLTIRDRGIGIRLDDAAFMLRLGSSKRNPYRGALKRWLPDWARPSGTFGIGFHSLFLYCHEVRVISRHPDDPDGIELTFLAEDHPADPTVLIKKRSRLGREITFAPPTGTVIEAQFRVDRLARDRSRSMRREMQDRRSRGTRTLNEYDFVLHQEVPQAAAAISEQLYEMVEGSLCPVRLNLPIGEQESESDDSGSEVFRHFDSIQGIEVRVREYGLDCDHMSPRYRGSRIGGWSMHTFPFAGECDIHASEADDFLEISRNEFTRHGLTMARERLDNVLRSVTPSWLNSLRQATNEAERRVLPYTSLYAMLNEIQPHGEEWRSALWASSYKWRKAQPPTLDLGTIADAKEAVIGDREGDVYAAIEDNIVVLHGYAMDQQKDWLAIFLRKFFPDRRLESIVKGASRGFYRLRKGQSFEDVSDEVLAALLEPKDHGSSGRRHLLPCPARFAGLAYPDNRDGWRFGRDELILTTMANPFVYSGHSVDHAGLQVRVHVVEVPRVDEYVRWLAKQRNEPEAHVAEQLLQFIRYVDKLMDGGWHGLKNYDLKAVETALLQMKR
jgi:hypothetical protein